MSSRCDSISEVRISKSNFNRCCIRTYSILLTFLIVTLTLGALIYYFIENHELSDVTRRYSYFHELEDGFTRAVYYHEATWIIVDNQITSFYNITYQHCEVMKLRGQERDQIWSHFNETIKLQELSFSEIMRLMGMCDEIGGVGYNTTYKFSKKSSGTSLKILYGTKWCGKGNEGLHYNDLGGKEDLDKCCRAHDMCPVAIQVNETRYNLTNTGEYTWSHCECDKIFNACVKRVHGMRANWVQKSYFDYLNMTCIEDVEQDINSTSSSSSTKIRRLASSKKIVYEH